MANSYERSIQLANEIRNNIYVVASNWFVNKCPLVTRVPRVPVNRTTFTSGIKPVVTQFCETWSQRVYSRPSAYPNVSNPRSPFDQYKMLALANLMDDMEYSSYYGIGADPAINGRPNQKGLRTLITTHRYSNPPQYHYSSNIKQTLEAIRKTGGDPDVLILSTDIIERSTSLTRIDAGVCVFGNPIDVFESDALPGMSIINAPVLQANTSVLLTSGEVRMRMKRNEFWNPRGARGDSYEGDWIAEGAIEIDCESHHAWVEGSYITL